MLWDNGQLEEQLQWPLEQWEIDLIESAIYLNNVMIDGRFYDISVWEIDNELAWEYLASNCQRPRVRGRSSSRTS